MADMATIFKKRFEIRFPNGLSDHAEIYYGTSNKVVVAAMRPSKNHSTTKEFVEIG